MTFPILYTSARDWHLNAEPPDGHARLRVATEVLPGDLVRFRGCAEWEEVLAVDHARKAVMIEWRGFKRESGTHNLIDACRTQR